MRNKNDIIDTKKKYFRKFPAPVRKKALEDILDIRKFEIDMYWKRATYFWAFIGAALGGYIASLRDSEPTNLHRKGQFILITLGILFSWCWYLVNRGSKFWQENWEKHLDIMEDNRESPSPLYKMTIQRDFYKKRWCCPHKAYPFSVSKINILLSFFIFLLWLVIDSNFIYVNWSHFVPGLSRCHFLRDFYLYFLPPWWNLYTILLLFQIVSAAILVFYGRTDISITYIDFELRRVENKRDRKSE